MKSINSMKEIEELIGNNSFALLYFSSKECSVCTDLLPKVTELLKGYPKVEAAFIEAQELPMAMGAYNAFIFPCIIAFMEGKEVIREARFISIEELKAKIERYYDFIK